MPETEEVASAESLETPRQRAAKISRFSRLMRELEAKAKAANVSLSSGGDVHDVPRDVFDVLSGEVTEWRTNRPAARLYWSKKTGDFTVYTHEAPTAASREPERVIEVTSGESTHRQLKPAPEEVASPGPGGDYSSATSSDADRKGV